MAVYDINRIIYQIDSVPIGVEPPRRTTVLRCGDGPGPEPPSPGAPALTGASAAAS